MTDTGCRVMQHHNQLASHGAIYDMAIDPGDKIAITVGQVLVYLDAKFFSHFTLF